MPEGRDEVVAEGHVEEVLRESDGHLVAIWDMTTADDRILDCGVFDPRLEPDDFDYA